MRQQVLERGLNVLSLVFDFPRSTLHEIRDQLEMEMKQDVCERTVRRNLNSLLALGYVTKYRSGDGLVRWRASCKIVPNLRIQVDRRAA